MPDHEITLLLEQLAAGNRGAGDQLFAKVHERLKALAHQQMRDERADHTLQATALVNETYLSLLNSKSLSWEDRNRFFAYAAKVMRHVLVDYARSRNAQKRGGDQLRVTLSGLASTQPSEDLVALDGALEALAQHDQRKAEIIEMRFFGGLSTEEICEVTGLAESTVFKELKLARGWLFQHLSPGS